MADKLARSTISNAKRSTRASSVASEDGEINLAKGKKRAASEAVSSDDDGATSRKNNHKTVSKKSKSEATVTAPVPTPIVSSKPKKPAKPLTAKEKAALAKAEKERKQAEKESGVVQMPVRTGKIGAKENALNDEFNRLLVGHKPPPVKIGWEHVDQEEEQLRLQREAEEKAENPEKWTQEAKQKSFFVIEYLDMVRKDRIPPRSDIVLEEKYVGRPNFKRFRVSLFTTTFLFCFSIADSFFFFFFFLPFLFHLLSPRIRLKLLIMFVMKLNWYFVNLPTLDWEKVRKISTTIFFYYFLLIFAFLICIAYHGERRIHYPSGSNDNDDDDMDRDGTQPKLNFKSKPSAVKSTSASTSKGKSKGKGKGKAKSNSTDDDEEESDAVATGRKKKSNNIREEMEIDELDSDDSDDSITQTLTSNPVKGKSQGTSKKDPVVKAIPKKSAPTKKKQPAIIVIDSESDSDSGLTFKVRSYSLCLIPFVELTLITFSLLQGFASTAKTTGTKRKR